MSETRWNLELEPLYTHPSFNTLLNSRYIQGGGTLLRINQKMKSSEPANLTLTLPFFESVVVYVKLSGKKLIVGNTHKPPNSDKDSFLTEILKF